LDGSIDPGQLFPFNGAVEEKVEEKWRLGQGVMKFKYMSITELKNVSGGSWSPVIYVSKYPALASEDCMTA
jgi:bacteriocin-like protein